MLVGFEQLADFFTFYFGEGLQCLPTHCLALDHNTPPIAESVDCKLPACPAGWLVGWLASPSSLAKLTLQFLWPGLEILGEFVNYLGKFVPDPRHQPLH